MGCGSSKAAQSSDLPAPRRIESAARPVGGVNAQNAGDARSAAAAAAEARAATSAKKNASANKLLKASSEQARQERIADEQRQFHTYN